MEICRKSTLFYQSILFVFFAYLGYRFYPHFDAEKIPYLMLIMVLANHVFVSVVSSLVSRKFSESPGKLNLFQLFLTMVSNAVILAVFLLVYGKENIHWSYYLFAGSLLQVLLSFILNKKDLGEATAKLALLSVLTVALALSLRLQGIFASLLFASALLQGTLAFVREKDQYSALLVRALLFTASLALGRALCQIYLRESSYDSLGIVITHSYTFVALCIGLALPWIIKEIPSQKILVKLELLICFGVILPVLLGLFIHVRPIAAFALGLCFSQLVCALYSQAPLILSIISLFALSTMNLALPFYKEYLNMPRLYRVYLFLGLAVIAFIYHVVRNVLFKKSQPAV